MRTLVVVVLGGVIGAVSLMSAATAQTVTDPTGSVSVGLIAGSGGSNADGSVLAYSMDGCARSGLVAVSFNPVTEPISFLSYTQREQLYQALGYQQTSCPWSGYAADAPVAVAAGPTRGAVSVSTSKDAYGWCWNPLNLGCLPSLAYAGGYGSAYGGTVSWGGESCSAYDWGLVPGIAVCDGGQHTEESASGSIAVMTGAGASHGRLFAYSGGNSSPFRQHHAYSDNVAVSEWGKAYGSKVAVSVHHSAYAGAGGVAIAGITWPMNLYPNPADASTGPGGVAIAGGRASGGMVVVGGTGDATGQGSGGVLAVSGTGQASGAAVTVSGGDLPGL